MSLVHVRVPGSSANLGPGFDALGLALNLYSFIEFSAGEESGDHLSMKGEGEGLVPLGEDSIVLEATNLFWQAMGMDRLPVRARLRNEIPLARGLGSSAAVRVGILNAANEWVRLQGMNAMSADRIMQLASQLEGHPDNVAASMIGGLVVAIDDESGPNSVKAIQVSVKEFPALVVFVPHGELATKSARAALADSVSRADAVFNLGRSSLLVAALGAGRWDLLPWALRDRIHQDRRASLMPGFHSIKDAACAAGAYGATLSGAGPSIMAWVPPEESVCLRVSQAMSEEAMRHGVDGNTRRLDVELTGCIVEKQNR